MCVYVFAYMHTIFTCVKPPRVHAGTLCAHAGTFIHRYVCTCGYMCIHVCIFVRGHLVCMPIHCVCMHLHAHISVFVRVGICVQVYMHI